MSSLLVLAFPFSFSHYMFLLGHKKDNISNCSVVPYFILLFISDVYFILFEKWKAEFSQF